jgi:hypothetical protein
VHNRDGAPAEVNTTNSESSYEDQQKAEINFGIEDLTSLPVHQLLKETES